MGNPAAILVMGIFECQLISGQLELLGEDKTFRIWRDLPPPIHRAEISWVHGAPRNQNLGYSTP